MEYSGTVTKILQNYPSIFEIEAADCFNRLLHPAISKVIEFAGNLCFGRETKYHDEICLLLNAVLQSSCIFKQNATFGELFYGIEYKYESQEHLRLKKALLAAYSIIPGYAEAKAKTRQGPSTLWHIISYVVSLNKLLHAIMKFLYILRYTKSPSLATEALKISIQNSNPFSEGNSSSFLIMSFEAFAFLLNFLQWWYNSDAVKSIPSLPNPMLEKLGSFSEIGSNQRSCPICLEIPTLSTALSTSGYVFCFKCINGYLKKYGHCPVTRYPADFADLIRIYDH
uniref:Peroxisome assembly protein 12 n=1 Tax=Tabanus bromius TaxID=304241 RepID=A0A0K8TT91_TABBR